MEINNLFHIFSQTDSAIRKEALKYVPSKMLSIFSTCLVEEIIFGRIPIETVLQNNLIEYEHHKIYNKIELITAIQTIDMIKKWLENNKSLMYRDVLISTEINLAFQVIICDFTTDEQFEVATSFLQKLVELINVNHIDHQIEDNFFNVLLNLRFLFNETHGLAKLKSICKLYTSIGEKLVQRIELNSGRLLIVHQILLICAYHRELVELVFPFWRQLSKSIKSEQKKHFLPYVEEFILVLTKHCRYSNVVSGAMIINDDDGNELVAFRLNVFKLFEKISTIIDCKRTLMFYVDKVHQERQSYEDVEVCLFIIKCFIRNIDFSENLLVPQLIQSILRVDEGSILAISYMSIEIIKELSGWLSYHQEYLISILNFLSNFFLRGGSLAIIAAESIAEICGDSKTPMQAYINELFQLIHNLKSFSLPAKTEIKLIKGVSKVVYNFSNDQQIYYAMKILCDIQLSKISFYRDTHSSAIVLVDQLAEIYSNIPTFNSINNPAVCVFIENWLAISHMLDYYRNAEDVLKNVVEVILCAIESLGISLHPILEIIIIKLLDVYCDKKIFFILRCIEKLILILGKNSAFSQGLFIAFESFTIATFDGLNVEDKMNMKLLDEFYHLSTTCVKEIPLPFLKSQLILPIIDLALEGCKINDKDINKSAMNFIMSIIDCNCFHKDIDVCVLEALTRYSRQIIYILIISSAFVYDKSLMTNVADILFAIKNKSHEGFKILLIETMKSIVMKNISTGKIINTGRQLTLIVNSLIRPNIQKVELLNELNKFYSLFRCP